MPKLEPNSKHLVNKIKSSNIPILLIINKIDLSNQQNIEEQVEKWKDILPDAEIFPISALEKFQVENLLERLIELLPA